MGVGIRVAKYGDPPGGGGGVLNWGPFLSTQVLLRGVGA